MNKTGLKSILISKIIGTVLMTLGLFYVGITAPIWAPWAGLAWIISLLAIHSVRDHDFTRDYSKEPVTDAESRQDVVQILVDHLESASHDQGDCDPCPVPGLLEKLQLATPQEARSNP